MGHARFVGRHLEWLPIRRAEVVEVVIGPDEIEVHQVGRFPFQRGERDLPHVRLLVLRTPGSQDDR